MGRRIGLDGAVFEEDHNQAVGFVPLSVLRIRPRLCLLPAAFCFFTGRIDCEIPVR
jgi:hypothetical protein